MNCVYNNIKDDINTFYQSIIIALDIAAARTNTRTKSKCFSNFVRPRIGSSQDESILTFNVSSADGKPRSGSSFMVM